eukprot:GHRQ01037232.1.p1 GENE.GHRQ01037232.1~~GHRQ01037232.1.p1  ORF type:complete len:202 (+),score=19.72 GHRQ01037232.1:292-897(+)
MEPIVTDMCSQLRKVRSLAKKVLGSTRVRTSVLPAGPRPAECRHQHTECQHQRSAGVSASAPESCLQDHGLRSAERDTRTQQFKTEVVSGLSDCAPASCLLDHSLQSAQSHSTQRAMTKLVPAVDACAPESDQQQHNLPSSAHGRERTLAHNRSNVKINSCSGRVRTSSYLACRATHLPAEKQGAGESKNPLLCVTRLLGI